MTTASSSKTKPWSTNAPKATASQCQPPPHVSSPTEPRRKPTATKTPKAPGQHRPGVELMRKSLHLILVGPVDLARSRRIGFRFLALAPVIQGHPPGQDVAR